MSIRSTFTGLSAALIALLVGLFVILGLLVLTQQDIRQEQQRGSESARLADVLRHTSDGLTGMARLYVVTGEPRYHDWFHEIIAIRNGSAPRPVRYDLVYWDLVGPDDARPRASGNGRPLEDLMVDAGLSVEEFNKLREAQSRSDELARIEDVAMNAAEGRFDDGTGQFALSRAPDLVMARDLMFGDQYMAQKARIMAPINEFVVLIEERTARR